MIKCLRALQWFYYPCFLTKLLSSWHKPSLEEGTQTRAGGRGEEEPTIAKNQLMNKHRLETLAAPVLWNLYKELSVQYSHPGPLYWHVTSKTSLTNNNYKPQKKSQVWAPHLQARQFSTDCEVTNHNYFPLPSHTPELLINHLFIHFSFQFDISR